MKYWNIFLLALLLISCGKEKPSDDNVLLRYEERVLTYDDVISQIPVGLDSADSIALFNAIVEGWIKDEVLSELAEQRLYDLNQIERKVRDYRNNLIVEEYLNRMRESHEPKIDELRVKEYYDKHRSELKLEVPLVKGIFLKINSESKGKENIKHLLNSESLEAIDKLEQEWWDKALEYSYFEDKWTDWGTITSMIPYRFGNADEFLEKNQYFETEYGDCSYFLKITEYLPSGEEQPFEFASKWITDMMTQADILDYENALVESIVKQSLKNKKLEAIGYDPLMHELKENNVIHNDE